MADVTVLNQASGDNWHLWQGDCCEVVGGIPDDSVGFTIYSPPFASLYVYSASERDMGNVKDYDEFCEHYQFLIRDLLRVTKPGRLCSVHCMNLPTTKQHHNEIGIQDFRGDIIRSHKEAGWIFHSEAVIWKDPVTAMQRTKALGLLHKQVVKDSCMSRQGIPDYVCTFRKPGVNPEPVEGEFDRWIGDDTFLYRGKTWEQVNADYRKYLALPPKKKAEWIDCGGIYQEPDREQFDSQKSGRLSIDIWQRYASPVWMDINATRTLQYTTARDDKDDRHICPLQLDVIERCVEMWSNPGDTVLDPFNGIGSSGHVALLGKRKYVGIELKESYFRVAAKNLKAAAKKALEIQEPLLVNESCEIQLAIT